MLWAGRFDNTNKPASHKYKVIEPIEGPTEVFFFGQIRKINSKIYVDEQRDRNRQENSKEKNYAGRFFFSYINTYVRTTIINTT